MNLFLANPGNELLTPPNQVANPAMKRIGSSTSLVNASGQTTLCVIGIANVYYTIWKALSNFANDPYPEVAEMAQKIFDEIKKKAGQMSNSTDTLKESVSELSYSEPASPSQQNHSYLSDSPINFSYSVRGSFSKDIKTPLTTQMLPSQSHQSSVLLTPYSAKRHIFGREPSTSKSDDGILDESGTRNPIVNTNFLAWCSSYFSQSVIPFAQSERENHSKKQHEIQ